MMGQLPAGQNSLFYEFCLEKHVPVLTQRKPAHGGFATLMESERYECKTGDPALDSNA